MPGVGLQHVGLNHFTDGQSEPCQPLLENGRKCHQAESHCAPFNTRRLAETVIGRVAKFDADPDEEQRDDQSGNGFDPSVAIRVFKICRLLRHFKAHHDHD